MNKGMGADIWLKEITHTIDAFAHQAFLNGCEVGRAEGLRKAARILETRAAGWRAQEKNHAETPTWARADNAKALTLEEEAKNLHGLAQRPEPEPAKTCGTCKHWGVGDTQRDREEDTVYRPCGAVVHDESNRARPAYDDPETDEDGDPYDPKIKVEIAAIRKHLAVVHDGSGFYAALKVRQDFGCVLHTGKGR
jgi:hypothetical protein